jgi:hypothetical protein
MASQIAQFLLILATIVSGCKANKPHGPEYDGMTMVTVADFSNLDGCTYLLKTASNEFLEPMNLNDSLKTDGLQIAIRFKPSKNASICMKGKPIDILSVKAIKQ